MGDLWSSTLDTIGQVGDGIDKFTGGRALRGLVGGKGREALSILPFSDTLGITDAKDKTSGRDLTDKYGLTSKGDNSFGSHAAGFLADNILSPGNMLGAYGAFKAAPTIAKGLKSGAKALTGLDLLDHVRSGGKAIGGMFSKKADNILDSRLSSLNPVSESRLDSRLNSLKQPPDNPLNLHSSLADKVETGFKHPDFDVAKNNADMAISNAADGLGYTDQDKSLALKFFRHPDLNGSADPLSLADRFGTDLRNGVESASQYRGNPSNEINEALRNFGGNLDPMISKIRNTNDYNTIEHSAMMNVDIPKVNPDFVADPTLMQRFTEAHPHETPDSFISNNSQFKKYLPDEFKKIFGERSDDYLGHFRAVAARNAYETSDAFANKNSTLRSISGLMDLLDHSRTPRPMELYRGVAVDGLKKIEDMIGVPLSSPEAIGREFTDNGFLSTSMDKNVSNMFAHLTPTFKGHASGAVFHFPDVPEGKSASYMNPMEREILFPPGRKIKIDDNSDYPNSIRATLATMLPPGTAPPKPGNTISSLYDEFLKRPGHESEPWFHAVKEAEREGVEAIPVPGKTWSDKHFNAYDIAHYQPGFQQNFIRLNADLRTPEGSPWLNPNAMWLMLNDRFSSKISSSSHPLAIIDHELGHAFHYQSVGDDTWRKLKQMGQFDGKENRLVTNRVSEYAKTNPLEFVAETYAGLKGGKDYRDAPNVGKWFRNYAGTPFLDRISNSGLGKGLGLSLLGAYGYGSMNSQPEASNEQRPVL